ncbi:MAG: hypothetical protein ACM37W_06500 [Actinomycetota bacterium]
MISRQTPLNYALMAIAAFVLGWLLTLGYHSYWFREKCIRHYPDGTQNIGYNAECVDEERKESAAY